MNDEDVVQSMLDLDNYLAPAAEDLRRRLNKVVAHWRLNGEAVLTLLARLSAGYIVQLQKAYDKAGAQDIVEEHFQTILSAYLTSYDMERVNGEIEKMKNKELN